MDNNQFKEALSQPVSEQSRNMGLGKLAEPQTLFVRNFRWTLESDGLPEYCLRSVSFDFKWKTVDLSMMEVVFENSNDIDVMAWLERDHSKDIMTFTTYDGCGKAVYEYKIKGLQVVSDNIKFDYSSSDTANRQVKLKYDSIERNYLYKKQPVKKGFDWTLGFPHRSQLFEVKVKKRPQLNVEETEMNFLSSKQWIPGKAEWESMFFVMDKQAMKAVMAGLFHGERGELQLKLWQRGMDRKPLETWHLNGVRIDSTKLLDDETYQVEVSYKSVQYISEVKNEKDRNDQARQ